jgi:hypothetical protein
VTADAAILYGIRWLITISSVFNNNQIGEFQQFTWLLLYVLHPKTGIPVKFRSSSFSYSSPPWIGAVNFFFRPSFFGNTPQLDHSECVFRFYVYGGIFDNPLGHFCLHGNIFL